LRYYEQVGILNYPRNDASYRYFDSLDVTVFMRFRTYRAYGFSLKESVALLNQDSLPDLTERLEEREKALAREIAWNQQIRRHLRSYLERLRALEKDVGCFVLTERPPLYGILFLTGNKITADRGLRRRVSRWMTYAPLPQPLYRYDLDRTRQEDGGLRVGLCLSPDDVEYLHVEPDTHVFKLEPLPCVYSVVKSPVHLVVNQKTVTSASWPLFPAITEMARHNLEPAGPIYGRTFVSIGKYRDRVAYSEYWIPCRAV
jgi:DNA-binding transcriptional MerR regulator